MTNKKQPPDGGREASQSNGSSVDEGGPSRRTFLKGTAAAGAVALGVGAGAVGSVSAGIPTPQLHRDGNLIKDPDGNVVTLRGVNIADPKRINVTAPARGKDAVQVIDMLTDASNGWYPRMIRVPVQPVDIGEYEPGSGPPVPAFTEGQLESYLTNHLDEVVQRCAERGVYCIIDYHRHRDVQWAEGQDGPVNAELQDEVDMFWDIVAPRYAEDSHVLYEVYNEPTEPGMWEDPTTTQWVADIWDLWLEMAQPWVDTIRSHADNMILMGSPSWTQSPEGALVEEFDGEDIAYTYHIYPGHNSSRQQNWEDASINGEGVEGVYEQAPLFVTEFGWEEGGGQYIGGTDEFGTAFHDFLEQSPAIHWTAWCADPVWRPVMFERPFADNADDSVGDPYNGTVPEACSDLPCEWSLTTGSGAMGDDIKSWLEQYRNDGIPGEGTVTPPTDTPTPTDEPNTPTDEPETPTDEPDTPTDEPDTPTDEPDTPTDEPDTPTDTPAADAMVVDNYDGSPGWSSHRNDLGEWCGAGSFENGGGEEMDGALVLEYDNGGWFQEQINEDVSDYSTLVFEISGADGGEESEVLFDMGGVRTLLANVTDDTIGTSMGTVRVDLAAAGVDRSSPSVRFNFWQGGASTLELSEIRLE
ncbi:cellulase family glycosylhydrolase [Halosimplex rubrum]|uniref:Cellulase family glycosylhydrolase n=1 Tax=Halosimplex rubrum TaxID=869889 RepID=A0A7D5T4P0_9EURY|nr:cellulase family glycosylhydrolase [Halosimplex rubrum]QLH77149.1 cellulase family glycosylhydrolase [Halosimplex rubrum]